MDTTLLDLPSELILTILQYLDMHSRIQLRRTCKDMYGRLPLISWTDYFSDFLSKRLFVPRYAFGLMTIDDCRELVAKDCGEIIEYACRCYSDSILFPLISRVVCLDDIEVLKYMWTKTLYNSSGDLINSLLIRAYMSDSTECFSFMAPKVKSGFLDSILTDALASNNETIVSIILKNHSTSIDTITSWDLVDLIDKPPDHIQYVMTECIDRDAYKCFRCLLDYTVNQKDVADIMKPAYRMYKPYFMKYLIPRCSSDKLCYHYGLSIETLELIGSKTTVWCNKKKCLMHPNLGMDCIRWAVDSGAKYSNFSIFDIFDKEVLVYLLEIFRNQFVVDIGKISKSKNYRLLRILLSRGTKLTVDDCCTILLGTSWSWKVWNEYKIIKCLYSAGYLRDRQCIDYILCNRLTYALSALILLDKPYMMKYLLDLNSIENLAYTMCAIRHTAKDMMVHLFPSLSSDTIDLFLSIYQFKFTGDSDTDTSRHYCICRINTQASSVSRSCSVDRLKQNVMKLVSQL